MANRRMISNAIVKSARFLRMPPTSQNLYFHLILNADDDGIVEAFPIMRMTSAVEDDLKILMEKKFIEVLNEDLVTYIYDWLEHNKIRADRKVDSVYKGLLFNVLPDVEYRGKVPKKEPKKEPTTPSSNKGSDDNHRSDKRQTDDRQTSAQDRLGKDRLGKDSVVEEKIETEGQIIPAVAASHDLSGIFNFWEQNGFGMLAPKTRQDLEFWVNDFQEIGATEKDAVAIVLRALEISVDNNARKYNYANSILKSWEQKRMLTVQQIEAEDKRPEKGNNGNRNELEFNKMRDDVDLGW